MICLCVKAKLALVAGDQVRGNLISPSSVANRPAPSRSTPNPRSRAVDAWAVSRR